MCRLAVVTKSLILASVFPASVPSLMAEPTGGSFWHFYKPSDSSLPHQIPHWLSWKPPCCPPLVLTILDHLLVIGIFFLSAVSSQPSCQWMVSSIRMTFFPSWDHKTMAGLSVVDSDSSWKWSFLLKSPFISHPRVNCSRFTFASHITTGSWLSFTTAMVLISGFVFAWCFFLLSCSKMWESSHNHLSWHRLYLSWFKAILQHEICFTVHFAPRNLYRGPPISHMCKMNGVGMVSLKTFCLADCSAGDPLQPQKPLCCLFTVGSYMSLGNKPCW